MPPSKTTTRSCVAAMKSRSDISSERGYRCSAEAFCAAVHAGPPGDVFGFFERELGRAEHRLIVLCFFQLRLKRFEESGDFRRIALGGPELADPRDLAFDVRGQDRVD